MRDILEELLQQLSLERIEENLFRGQSQDLGWGRVYGGQVLGQALSAAAQTVEGGRLVHSMHAYFLRPGDVNRPVVYEVDRIRDGRSFTTRRVVAVQKGKAILNMAASFQVEEEGLDHQDEMPDVAGPDGLMTDADRIKEILEHVPESMRSRLSSERPIEIRAVEPMSYLKPEKRPPTTALWFRATHEVPDDPAVHRSLLAYASDSGFITTALRPHGMTWASPNIQLASLDHAMWFHRPFRMDEWLLYVVHSPSASGARGLVRGQFYRQDGTRVASAAQEGLMRVWKKPKG